MSSSLFPSCRCVAVVCFLVASIFFYRPAIKIFSYRDKLLRSLLPTASPNLYLFKYKSYQMKYSLYPTKYRLRLMLGSSLPWTL